MKLGTLVLGLLCTIALLASGETSHAQPLVVGCADGTREGYTNVAQYPLIASCGGAWNVAGAFHDEPDCNREAGNDGVNANGIGCNVEDLCAGGWHVCNGPDDIDVRTAGNGCNDSVAAGYPRAAAFFMTRTSGAGTGHCDEVVNGFPANFNDIFGCGTLGTIPVAGTGPGGCSPLNRFGHNMCQGMHTYTQVTDDAPASEFGYSSSEYAWDCDDGTSVTESQFVLKTRPGDQGGVLCCKDTDGSLPEICDNGTDNDADGQVDETYFSDANNPNDGQLDYPGDPCFRAGGAAGTIECNGAGGWVCGPTPPQGCCFPDGQCAARGPGVCTNQGGSPGGSGSTCESMNCQAQECYLGNGSSCDDGDPCTDDDTCANDNCAGTPKVCNDNNPCTSDSCQAGGCVFANNANACNDNNACTTNDVCSGGSCNGASVSCDDGNVCTDDTCHPASGCAHANNTDPCDDGEVCTDRDACVGGACSGLAISCDDANPCTDDTCGPNGCTNTNNTAACNDGNACTVNDTCSGGGCAGAPMSCDDTNPCTDDSCSSGSCGHVNNTNACSDGDGCTGGDVCAAGLCLPGTTPLCEPDCALGDRDEDGICDDKDDCIDMDRDGYGVGDDCEPDCNDAVPTCTTDCVTDMDGGDGNDIPDCEEAQCADADGDGYGVGEGCSGPDCDDGEPECASSCTDTDGDQTPDCIDADDDADGLSDDIEALEGSNPKNPDSDNDGVSDSDEVLVHHTDPTKGDSDGDGTSDKDEIAAGTNPTDPLEGGSKDRPGVDNPDDDGPGGGGDSSDASSDGCAGGHGDLLALGLGVLAVLRRRIVAR